MLHRVIYATKQSKVTKTILRLLQIAQDSPRALQIMRFHWPYLLTTPTSAMCCFHCTCLISKQVRVIKSYTGNLFLCILDITLHCIVAYPGHKAKYTTLLYYNGNVTMAHRVCAVESSNFQLCSFFGLFGQEISRGYQYNNNNYLNA